MSKSIIDLYFSRKCDVCSTGMEEGYLVGSGAYACSKKCLNDMDNYSHAQFLKDYKEEDEHYYYTNWEQDWEDEETLFLIDGTEVSNPYQNKEYSL